MNHTSSVCRKIATANPRNAKNYRGHRFSKNRLLGRPNKRQVTGTVDTAFRGRRKAKLVRLRKLQRQARKANQ